MTRFRLTRRRLLTAGAVTVGGLILPGCDRLNSAPSFQTFLGSAQGLTYRAQRLLVGQAVVAELIAVFGQPRVREEAQRAEPVVDRDDDDVAAGHEPLRVVQV